jgi:hypothetical protein
MSHCRILIFYRLIVTSIKVTEYAISFILILTGVTLNEICSYVHRSQWRGPFSTESAQFSITFSSFFSPL